MQEKIDLNGYNIRLTVVRHGEDEQDKMGGWSDNHLTARGIEEVEETALTIGDNFDLMLASDLVRARETAEILLRHVKCPVIYDAGLRETNNGIYKNMSKAEFNEKGYKRFASLALDECYGVTGESPVTFFERVKGAFIKILETHRDKKLLLVTHGGVIKVMLCLINGTPYFNFDNSLIPRTGQKIEFYFK